jgi:hypothetical protein
LKIEVVRINGPPPSQSSISWCSFVLGIFDSLQEFVVARRGSHRLKAQNKLLEHRRIDADGCQSSHYNLKDIVQTIEIDTANR